MNKLERILALEAALCACEGIAPNVPELHKFLDKEIEDNFSEFGDFLAAQQKAIEKLSKSPKVFGW